jgi:hypothetical protein
MKNLDYDELYRHYILLIVYFYNFPHGRVYQQHLSAKRIRRRRAAMAEPLHSIWRKACVILSARLLSISAKGSPLIIILFKKAAPKFARGIEIYIVYMVGDDI